MLARSIWKGVFFSKNIYFNLIKFNLFKQRRWIITSRNSSIPVNFIHSACSISKGLNFRHIYVRKLYIGHKFGEFSFTRKNYHFIPKEKKSKLRR